MGINRSEAYGRMQRSLMAWQRVAATVGITVRGRAAMPKHDRSTCKVCRGGSGRCVFVDAAIVSEADLEILADGFDLMSQLWCEVESVEPTREPDEDGGLTAHEVTTAKRSRGLSVVRPVPEPQSPCSFLGCAFEAGHRDRHSFEPSE